MAQNGRPAVFLVEELAQEHVHRRPKRVYRKVPDVLRKREERERNTE